MQTCVLPTASNTQSGNSRVCKNSRDVSKFLLMLAARTPWQPTGMEPAIIVQYVPRLLLRFVVAAEQDRPSHTDLRRRDGPTYFD